MRKQYKYKCMFSSINLLSGTLGHYTVYVIAYNIKEAMKFLRSQGYHLGKDFVYWNMQYNSKEDIYVN